MAIKTKDELIKSLNAVLGDNASDEALALMEDVSDTLDDNTAKGAVDWEQKYRENDQDDERHYESNFSFFNHTPIITYPVYHAQKRASYS